MNCPHCGGETHVVDSRPNEDSTRRRRECVECKHRFSTVEIDADYYETLKPIDKNAVQKAVQQILLDGCANITEKVYSALGIKERNSKNENENYA